ncbi:D-alanyl-D-alanine carboxypeptidase/D-alanyl-D-alanine-endopeptidase [Kineosporia sp. J2-2]|uniref:D-alanyl-D-alanine carboxypeptidase/D-alanyl-D-alanine-endopeptidase n=1 Tax=Kineosporia corallincola TaxID=2835133 RepID=A0ABS5TBW8_9ACTN|nr:D-alanyl-D-alanine carboxypeptidase/D-alanyl-D-alanine-endopeptidase [Kineosporia corallincola]MBT0767696.1 D-alanyl-D-alanine carboxypeptidase/D-alanyl-D-alanine-endopeptidase [Kineosporia corallincola]
MTGVPDVTQRSARRLVVRLAVVLAVLVAALIVALTVLGPFGDRQSTSPQEAIEPLTDRVPGAVLPDQESPDVLPSVDTDAPEVSATKLTQRMSKLIGSKDLGKSVSVDVLDPLTGEHLMGKATGTARAPASTAKLLTTAAALSALGPQTTLTTSAVTDGDTVYLIGGGDVLLGAGESDEDVVNGHAGLATLAEEAAAQLEQQGVDEVRVALDDTLFEGDAMAAGWSQSDVDNGYVAPVYAAEISAGRLKEGNYVPRSQDPGLAAAKTFAAALADAGVTVAGSVQRDQAPDDATSLAAVESSPLGDQVEFALDHSDNTVAEALGRLVAIDSGTGATFEDTGPAVLAELEEQGVPVDGATMADGSGLSADSRIPVETLTAVLALAAGDDGAQLRPMLTGMPIAGVSGTLAERFTATAEQDATGVVRAKTGTLSGVSSLAGTLVDADGRLLVFAVMADDVPSTTKAREALDAFAAGLVGCGC